MSYFCVAKSESCCLGPHASTETSSMNSFIRHDQPARVVSVIVRLGIAVDTPYWRYQTSTSIIQAIDGNSSRSSRHWKTGMIPRKRSWSSASAGGSSILVKASMSQVGVCLLALAPAGRFSSKRCKNLRMFACIVSWLGDAASARKAVAEDEEAMFSANTGA